MQALLEIEYGRSSIAFDWTGFDEMDEVSGEGTAELLDDGSIEIESSITTARRSRSQGEAGAFFNSLLREIPSSELPSSTSSRRLRIKLTYQIRNNLPRSVLMNSAGDGRSLGNGNRLQPR
jgi:hypothetical protein